MSPLLPYNPAAALPPRRFGLLPVRSPLLGESLDYFLLLEVLRCLDEPEASAIRPSLLSNSRRDRSTSDVHVLGGVKDTAETLSFLTYKSCL